MTTESIRKGNLGLAVLPGSDKTAQGDLFWDDGDSIDTIEKNEYNFYSFDLQKNCSLDIKVIKSGYSADHTLESITVFGTTEDKVEATLDGKPIEGSVREGELTFTVKLNLKSKKVGEKWNIKWMSTKTNSCNIV